MSRPLKRHPLLSFFIISTIAIAAPAFTQTTPADVRDAPLVALPPVSQIFEREKSKVVSIQTELAAPEGHEMFRFFGPAPNGGPRLGMGSGFIVDPAGYVITNNHVVDGASVIKVGFENGSSYDATLVGADPKIDIALLKIDAEQPLPAVTLGSSSGVRVGEWVVAIGNPFGLDYSVTTGIVSAKGRNIGAGPYDDFIQTDASINPGNSGGPLFNLRGEVVAVNTAIIRDGQGIGFAVPIDIVTSVLPQLRENGFVVRGYIGTGIQDLDADLADSFGVKKGSGVLLSSIADGGPAATAGLQPGDIVTSFGDRPTRSSHELLLAVAETRPGSRAKVGYIRRGKRHATHVVVAERPDTRRPRARPVKNEPQENNARLGVAVRPVDERIARAMELRAVQGVVVGQVAPGSPAAKKLRPGDVIFEVEGRAINSSADLNAVVATKKPGEVMRMLVGRGGATTFLAVRLR